MNKEPVSWGGAITAVAVATIPVLRAFGVEVTEQQSSAVLGLLAAMILAGTVVVRSKVTPVGKAEQKIMEAFHATPGRDQKPTL